MAGSFNEIKKDLAYYNTFFGNIKQLRKRKQLCDIQIIAKFNEKNEERYYAHKIVLASVSPYFKARIIEVMKRKYEGKLDLDLRNFESENFPIILDYLYAGEVKCTIENVTSLFKYADTFELKSLKSVVIEFMKNNVTRYTWLIYWRFSETQNNRELGEKCEKFCRESLEDSLITHLEELKLTELIKIVKGINVNLVNERLTVLKYITHWIKLNEEERFQFFFELTEWSAFLIASAIMHLYSNERSKLKEFLRNMTFNKLQEFCTNRELKVEENILYICIKEWIYLHDVEPYHKFEKLLKLIDLTNMDKEFLKLEISTEKVIYENQNIEMYLRNVIGSSSRCIEVSHQTISNSGASRFMANQSNTVFAFNRQPVYSPDQPMYYPNQNNSGLAFNGQPMYYPPQPMYYPTQHTYYPNQPIHYPTTKNNNTNDYIDELTDEDIEEDTDEDINEGNSEDSDKETVEEAEDLINKLREMAINLIKK